jgi:hypothetical protein
MPRPAKKIAKPLLWDWTNGDSSCILMFSNWERAGKAS